MRKSLCTLYSVQGVALRYVDYALTGRFHSAWQLYSVLCLLYSCLIFLPALNLNVFELHCAE